MMFRYVPIKIYPHLFQNSGVFSASQITCVSGYWFFEKDIGFPNEAFIYSSYCFNLHLYFIEFNSYHMV